MSAKSTICAAIVLVAVSAVAPASAASSQPNLKYKLVREVTKSNGVFWDLTNGGELLGSKTDSKSKNTAFLWDPVKGKSTYFSLPSNGLIQATNEHGDLVGVTDPNGEPQPLFKAKGKPWRRLTLTGVRTKAGFVLIEDINAKGQIVGKWIDFGPTEKNNAFISDTKAKKNLILKYPKANDIETSSINAAGVVVGAVVFDPTQDAKGFVYNFGGHKKFQVLKRSGFPSTGPRGVSDAGVVVGGFFSRAAFAYVGAFLHPLGTNIWATIPKAKGKKIVVIEKISPNGKYLLALDKDSHEYLYKRV